MKENKLEGIFISVFIVFNLKLSLTYTHSIIIIIITTLFIALF